jgi:hypothetical protein
MYRGTQEISRYQKYRIWEDTKTNKWFQFRRTINKHQSETANIINREINELKVKIDNIKEEVTHDMENLRKKKHTKTQNTVEGHSSRLE